MYTRLADSNNTVTSWTQHNASATLENKFSNVDHAVVARVRYSRYYSSTLRNYSIRTTPWSRSICLFKRYRHYHHLKAASRRCNNSSLLSAVWLFLITLTTCCLYHVLYHFPSSHFIFSLLTKNFAFNMFPRYCVVVCVKNFIFSYSELFLTAFFINLCLNYCA